MDYRETVEFLYSLRLFGTKLGLENTFALSRLCGDPHQSLRFIHVAGTNGKGSVCAMLESIYRQSGLRVGLFTSPHLVSFTERIQANRVSISQEDVSRLSADLMQKLGGSIEHWPFRPTFFEFATVLALLYFREQKCELVIWETGMGGRLDATNIVTPLASVITNIQLDHQQWLGATLPQIAREKAGIIKPGIPVVTAATGDALEVIRSVAREKAAPLTVVEHTDSRVGEHLHLRGAHQRINASVALATVDALQPKLPARPEAVTSGLALTRWAGRLQELRVGNAMVLLDGAHNPDGARSLADALDGLFPTRERTLVIGLFRDKAWAEMCDILVPGSARVFLAPMQSDRSADLERVAEYCQQRWPNIAIINAPSSAAAMDAALAFPFVVVAGSLHLIGEVLQHLGVAPADAAERRLNEWDADRTQTEHKLRK